MTAIHRLVSPEPAFGLQAAARILLNAIPPWIQDLAMLVETVETARLAGAAAEWLLGAMVRLPFSRKICSDGGVVCSQALMVLAESAMVIACPAACNGYRPMSTIDQTTIFCGR